MGNLYNYDKSMCSQVYALQLLHVLYTAHAIVTLAGLCGYQRISEDVLSIQHDFSFIHGYSIYSIIDASKVPGPSLGLEAGKHRSNL